MWTTLIKGMFNLTTTWLGNRAEKSQAKHTMQLEHLRARTSADEFSAEGMSTSWKDEYLVLLLTAPLIIIFYASLTNDTAMIASVHQGFIAMDQLPEFYTWALMGAIASSFGIRSFERIKAK